MAWRARVSASAAWAVVRAVSAASSALRASASAVPVAASAAVAAAMRAGSTAWARARTSSWVTSACWAAARRARCAAASRLWVAAWARADCSAAASVARLAAASASRAASAASAAAASAAAMRSGWADAASASAACSAASRDAAAAASRLTCSAWARSRAICTRRRSASASAARARASSAACCSWVRRRRSSAVRAVASVARRPGRVAASVSAWPARAWAASAAVPARACAARERRRRRRAGGHRHGALDRQQLRLGCADRAREVAVAAGLPRLALERGELGFHLAAQVLGAGKVGLGGFQLQLGLVAARVQPGDAGRFLQHRAAVLGPGRDQRADPPLAHHRRGAGAGGEVGEQGLHVAGAHLLAVHPVGAAAAALELAGDLEFGLLMQRRRGEAARLFEGEDHFGDVARRPAGGAGEDHVVHLAAAQGAGVRFAHRPAQRLDHVRLAAAVRADHAGQPGADFHRGGFGEALEPADAKTRKADRQAWVLFRSGRAAASRTNS